MYYVLFLINWVVTQFHAPPDHTFSLEKEQRLENSRFLRSSGGENPGLETHGSQP